MSAEEENERKLQQQATNSELRVMLVDPNNKSITYLDPQGALVTKKYTLHKPKYYKAPPEKGSGIPPSTTPKD